MIIKTMYIKSFGGLRNRTIDLYDGVNVISGGNEAGKTSAAMFIKFIFYGLSSKGTKLDGSSEKSRFINRDTLEASGYAVVEASDGKEYRIERTVIQSDRGVREGVRITDTASGETINGTEPGEFFFDVPESVFTGTAFVSQNRPVKPDISGGPRGGSVENILTSADENIDIKRAQKKLDTVRRELLHRKGGGGEISELQEKQRELAAERDSNASRSAEILSVSSSVTDIRRKIEELDGETKKYSSIFAALEVFEKKKKFDELDRISSQINDVRKSVEMIDASPVGGDFAAEIVSAERDINAYAEAGEKFTRRMPLLTGERPSGERPVDTGEAGEAVRAERSSTLLFGFGIGLLVLGLLLAIVAEAMYFISGNKYFIPGSFAAVSVLTALMLFIVRAGKVRRIGEILKKWNADSVDEVEDAINEKIAVYDNEMSIADEREALDDEYDAAKARFAETKAKVSSLASKVNMAETDDISATVAALKKIAETARSERRSLTEKEGNLKGRQEILTEMLSGYDKAAVMREAEEYMTTEAGRKAAVMTPDDIKKASREKEFTERELESARRRLETLEGRLGELGKLTHSPEEYETMLNSLGERIEELKLRYDACELASSALEKAGENMRSDVIPRIARKASEIISASTGRYDTLTVDSSFDCGLGENGDIKNSEMFSRGTEDLAYISLRIALADEVFRKEKPVIVFDESFAHVDSSRIDGIMRILENGDGQYIVFTCRSEEADAALAIGCRVIRL